MNDDASKTFDLVTIGRSSIDLYANDIGAPFAEIGSFGAFVGGCPTNVAVGARRLGLRTALLTAVGDDPVADFLLRFLDSEGVDTSAIATKPGRRTSAVLLGIQPPDRFPLVFYRDNAADVAIDADDVLAAPVDRTRALLVTGTGLAKDPARSATMLAVERAQAAGARIILDLDFRLDQWHDARAYGVAVRALLPLVEVAIGTEEEIKMAASVGRAVVRDAQVSCPEVSGDVGEARAGLFARGLQVLVAKRGEHGSQVCFADGSTVDAAPFSVDVVNVLGAGDAFAAGLVYGLLEGWDWSRSARMANATGAIVVTRQGCANFMPTRQEALDFIEARGGF